MESSLSTLSIISHSQRVQKVILILHLPHASGTHETDITYFGPVISMSSPSLISPTIFASIEEGVVRTDFVATDDLYKDSWFNDIIGSITLAQTEVSNLSGF